MSVHRPDIVQDRISRPINGSKWVFHMRRPAGIYKNHDIMTYFSRSTDFRLWPHYLLQGRTLNSRGFGLSIRAYIRQSVDRVKILSKVESQDLLMVAS